MALALWVVESDHMNVSLRGDAVVCLELEGRSRDLQKIGMNPKDMQRLEALVASHRGEINFLRRKLART